MEQPAVERLQRAFQTTKCGSLIGRDDEIKRLQKFVEQHLSSQDGGALYVSGAPGTGKTACVLHSLEKQTQRFGASTFYLNCMRIQRSHQVFGEISNFLRDQRCSASKKRQSVKLQAAPASKGESSLKEVESALAEVNRGMFVLVVDEVDYLIEHTGRKSVAQSNSRRSISQVSKRADDEISITFVLSSLFRLALRPGSRLILVAISNTLNLLDTVMQKCQIELEPLRLSDAKVDENVPRRTNNKSGSMAKCIERLQFTAYSNTQIVSILQARLAEFDCSELFETPALILIARRVCAESGDVRRALECALYTAEFAAQSCGKRSRRSEIMVEQRSEGSTGAFKVTVRDANAAWTSLQNRSTTSHFVIRDPQRESDVRRPSIAPQNGAACHPLTNVEANATQKHCAVSIKHDINGNEIQIPMAAPPKQDQKQNQSSGVLSDIPIHQKVILCSLVKLVDATRRNEVSMAELRAVYNQVVNATRMERLSDSEFDSSCALLESLGLVSFAEASKRGANNQRQVRIRLLSNVADLRSLLTEFDRTALLNNQILNGGSLVKKRKLSL